MGATPGGVTATTSAASRLTTVTDWDSNVTSYSYDDAGRMTLVELPNGALDDEYPACLETYLTFRVIERQPNQLSDDIAAELSQVLTLVGRRSAERSYQRTTEHEVQSRDVRRHLDWILACIEPIHSSIAAAQEAGCVVDVFVYWVSNWGHGGPMLNPEHLERLGSLGLVLGFDLYFREEEEAARSQ